MDLILWKPVHYMEATGIQCSIDEFQNIPLDSMAIFGIQWNHDKQEMIRILIEQTRTIVELYGNLLPSMSNSLF